MDLGTITALIKDVIIREKSAGVGGAEPGSESARWALCGGIPRKMQGETVVRLDGRGR